MTLLLLRRVFFAGLLLIVVVPAAHAQEDKDDKDKKAAQELIQKAEDEYRQFFKRPENVIQFWGAIKFEMETGKFDLAAFHIQEMLKLPADKADPDLLKIERAEGLNAFLRLQTVRQWSKIEKHQADAEKSVQTLIKRVSEVLEKQLSDPVRLNKLIKALDAATPEERTFAFVELKRARAKAVPYLIQALRTNTDNKTMYSRLEEAMVRLEPEIVPPLLQILRAADAKDALDLDLRPTILDILKRRGDKQAIPYLWHLSEAKQYPEPVRKQARALLSQLTETDLSLLPPAKMALVELAEKYFQHKIKFKTSEKFKNKDIVAGIRIWPWDGQKIPNDPVELGSADAEKYFCLRFAGEALDLDPTYAPAQRVLLSLTLERGFQGEVDQFLKPMPAAYQELLATIDAELLAQVLERALDDDNIPIMLPAIQALGERGDERAARLGTGGSPRGLMRALFYPDRRVQFSAIQALLKMPNHPGPAASMRMVDLLRRFIAAKETPKALLAYIPVDKADEARKAVKQLGFEPVLVKNITAAFAVLKGSADFDVLMVGTAVPDNELPFVLTQLRGDVDHGRLPLVVFATKDRQEQVGRLVNRQRLTKILPDTFLQSGEDLKSALGLFLQDGAQALSPTERKEINKLAMNKLTSMASGQIIGYDVRPAQKEVMALVNQNRAQPDQKEEKEAMPDPHMVKKALEILSRFPGREPQASLADFVLRPVAKEPPTPEQEDQRLLAAHALNRSVQKYGMLLDKNQIASLKAAHKTAKADDPLRAQLSIFLGNLRTTPTATGKQLTDFNPDAAPPPKKDKGKKIDKEEK